MEFNKKSKIKSASGTIVVLICIFAAMVGMNAIVMTKIFVEQGQSVDELGSLISSYLFLAFLLLSASMFRTVEKSETPFTKTIANRMKLMALFAFLCNELPRVICMIIRIIDGGIGYLTVANENTFYSLVVGFIFYCIALIFDYGCDIQEENFEIL